MTIPIKHDDLERFHPDYKEIKGMIDGPIKKFIVSSGAETCATQLSYAINTFNNFSNIGSISSPMTANGKIRYLLDSYGYKYVFSVIDLTEYLKSYYGKPEVHKGSKNQVTAAIGSRTGIISFGYRHIDIWVDGNIQRPAQYFVDSGLWGSDSMQKRGAFFWETA